VAVRDAVAPIVFDDVPVPLRVARRVAVGVREPDGELDIEFELEPDDEAVTDSGAPNDSAAVADAVLDGDAVGVTTGGTHCHVICVSTPSARDTGRNGATVR
jgi:hypothetical protein